MGAPEGQGQILPSAVHFLGTRSHVMSQDIEDTPNPGAGCLRRRASSTSVVTRGDCCSCASARLRTRSVLELAAAMAAAIMRPSWKICTTFRSRATSATWSGRPSSPMPALTGPDLSWRRELRRLPRRRHAYQGRAPTRTRPAVAPQVPCHKHFQLASGGIIEVPAGGPGEQQT
jgi:hypothetical protein